LRGIEAVTAADGGPVGVRDVALAPARRPTPRAVVLIARADAVRECHVVADDVGLPDRERVQEVPIAALVPRLRHTAVVTDDDVIPIVWIDPHRVRFNVYADGRLTDAFA